MTIGIAEMLRCAKDFNFEAKLIVADRRWLAERALQAEGNNASLGERCSLVRWDTRASIVPINERLSTKRFNRSKGTKTRRSEF